MSNSIDILAFGAHADDVEIGMGGSIAKWASEGKKIVICDLTRAELSSNGTVETRQVEAKNAAEILGVKERITLSLPDRGLYKTDDNILRIVEIIRTYKPTLVFAPYYEDRHPDHANCAYLVEEAFFSAGIRKITTQSATIAHKPNGLYHFMINGFQRPDFTVDITDYMDKKVESLFAYKSQFVETQDGVKTPLTDGYIETVQARERLFGKEVGTKYAEGFKSKKPILLNLDVNAEWKIN
ncbi:MAG: bacillithiol biosynthesis deacetylase BshB1 [Heyndrickxia sp.]